ncbi:MAG: hypothetical protein HFE78_08505 [Clostridiales bacterium]|nr:hypothetical protein [Clostridiales bacterium]
MSKFSSVNKVTVSAPLQKKLAGCLDNETKIFANNTFFRYLYPYTPYVTGTMSEDVDIDEEGIHYNSVYANRNYYGEGFNFSKEKHPLAQEKWGEVAGSIHGVAISREVENYVKSKKLK